MTRGQRDQDRRVVASRRHDHRAGTVDGDILQRLVARAVAAQHVAAQRLGMVQRLLAAVDHHDLARVGAARQQFVHRLLAAGAETGDDDMIVQIGLNACHAPPVEDVAEEEIIGGAEEEQHHEDADRRDDERVEHPRRIAHRHDIAVADRGDGDRGEIEHVDEADLVVIIVLETIAPEPVERQHDRDQAKDQHHPPREVRPDRQRRSPPQEAGHGRCRRRRRDLHGVGNWVMGLIGTRSLRSSKCSFGLLA